MKVKLNLFDRLMMAVTFAEAGVDLPEAETAGESCRHCKGEAAPRKADSGGNRAGRESIAAARS